MAAVTEIVDEGTLTGDGKFRGSAKLAKEFTIKLRMKLRNDRGLEEEIREESEMFRSSGGWRLLRKRDGSTFGDWEEFARDPEGLDAAASKWLRLVVGEARAAGPLGGRGGDRRSGKARENQGDNITLKGPKIERGTSASYLARRLMRDAPEIFRRLEAGEFPSVRQAAIAAGIVKVPTPLEKARRAVAKLSDEERVALFAEYDGMGRPRP